MIIDLAKARSAAAQAPAESKTSKRNRLRAQLTSINNREAAKLELEQIDKEMEKLRKEIKEKGEVPCA